MASCDILDFRCIFVSELVGSVFLATIIAMILYFIIASKLNWGFNTTIGFMIPIVLIMGLTFSGFSAIMAFLTIVVGLMLAWVFNKLIGNR